MTRVSPTESPVDLRASSEKKGANRIWMGIPSIRDPFGNIRILRQIVTALIGISTYLQINVLNRLKVIRGEVLQDLPSENVLFISNHQTYFADVIALYHIFSASKWGFKHINFPIYLVFPKVRAYYIAAEETMRNNGWLTRLFSYAGAVTVKRSWRHDGAEVFRSSDLRAPVKIKKALEDGWVINFPQGTTDQSAPVRKGSANIVRVLRPLVVPVRIDGFHKSFGKKSLWPRKRTNLTIEFFTPVRFEEGKSVDEIYTFLHEHIFGTKPDE